MTQDATPITIAYGDGIGPEVMEATLHVLQEAGANIVVESIEVGERIYRQGARDGVLPSAQPLLRRTGLLLLGPIVIPEHEKCEPLHLALANEFELRFSLPFDVTLLTNQPLPDTFGYQTQGHGFSLFSSTQKAEPKQAGKNSANPSAMLQAALMLLEHIEQHDIAQKVRAAWLQTLADGVHTKDMYSKLSSEKVGTREFAEAVVARL